MGKTWKKDKTVSKQKGRLDKTLKKNKSEPMPFQEFDYDEVADGPRYNRKELDQNEIPKIRPEDKLP